MRTLRLLTLLFGFSVFAFSTDSAYAQTIGPSTALSASPTSAAQRNPVGVWDGSQYIILWEDGRSSTDGLELYLARIDAQGQLLDSNGIRAWDSALAGNQSSPSIALDPATNQVIYAWTDPRSGGTQIYVARFNPQGLGTLLDGTGIAVTSGINTHAYPSIDCTMQSCLLAFQQAGSSEIFGRRISSNGTFMDANAIDLVSNNGAQNVELSVRVRARTSDFILAWEDDRNAGQGNIGADLFFGFIPESGSFGPLAAQTLSSANYRQTAPSLQWSSNNGFFSVWQDQRNGNFDIWFAHFDGNGIQQSATAISDRASNEVFPAMASGNGNSLVIWEDFRTAYGSIYAQFLDSSGQPSTQAAFSVLGFASNAIEQTVIKGPNNDFLVLAVEYDSTASKAHYRIIRDELPTGNIAANSALAPADGISTANVNFGPITGASGFEVIDDSLFTLNFPSSLNINVADADSNLPGHQVPSVNGHVQFGLASTTAGTFSLSLASLRGNASGQATVQFNNVAPSIDQASISPSAPTPTDALSLSYTYSDINLDPEGATEITWTKNNITQAAFNNLRSIPASATSPTERWRAMLRPHDGIDFGGFAFSNTVVIGPNPGSNTGDACLYNSDCNSGYCTDKVCCENRCGGASVDCQACSISAGSSQNGRCEAVAIGTVCRGEYGDCDLAESCDGSSVSCPNNQMKSVGTICRAASADCDEVEYCSGVSPLCPSDNLMSAGTPCRGRQGSCDVPEICDGTSAACPDNQLMAPNTICRHSSGPCDVAEVCDGQNGACPIDLMVNSGTPCRPAIGSCDLTEACDGMNALCPLNEKKTLGQACRESEGECDKEEVCSGISTDCPEDQNAESGFVCRAASGRCDAAEKCDGQGKSCPGDLYLSTEAVCRSAESSCDLDEHCSGDSIDCPEDFFEPDGQACDDQDRCTGDDACVLGQCLGGEDICKDDPNQQVPKMPALIPAPEQKPILDCKCASTRTDHSPKETILLLSALALFWVIRRKNFIDSAS